MVENDSFLCFGQNRLPNVSNTYYDHQNHTIRIVIPWPFLGPSLVVIGLFSVFVSFVACVRLSCAAGPRGGAACGLRRAPPPPAHVTCRGAARDTLRRGGTTQHDTDRHSTRGGTRAHAFLHAHDAWRCASGDSLAAPPLLLASRAHRHRRWAHLGHPVEWPRMPPATPFLCFWACALALLLCAGACPPCAGASGSSPRGRGARAQHGEHAEGGGTGKGS